MSGTIGAEYAPDYYKVIVPATRRFVVSLYDIQLNHAADELHVTLLRTTQNSIGTSYQTHEVSIAQSANDSATPDVIDIPDLARGIYFVKVWPARSGNWDGCDYTIQAEFTVFPPVVSDDVGDQKRYALPIVNQLATHCTLSGGNDVDYFECHVPYNTNLTLALTNIDAGGNVDMEVYTALDVISLALSSPGERLGPGSDSAGWIWLRAATASSSIQSAMDVTTSSRRRSAP